MRCSSFTTFCEPLLSKLTSKVAFKKCAVVIKTRDGTGADSIICRQSEQKGI